MACYLTQLPSEILHNILAYVEPKDLSVLPQTCQYLNVFIKDNSALHREIYYKILVKETVVVCFVAWGTYRLTFWFQG